ncbi:metallophosphoesterase family protein [Gluconobacter wancherniae]|uniref:metallophosphoesterase family protein n=1 Tax=Gluconobacter wancherniae TaxID=1307955 RepID=UPI0011BD98ED|nr:metallophosphoesterase [Gluconobacter wancherniae]MBF0853097.1 metallophosphoesterase [Gluconobacter wancherniae]GBD56185.1 metallophosphatase [Gluconobacter wancherniae NBRC 103581]
MSPEPSDTANSPRCDTTVTLAHLSDPHLPPPPVSWKEALNKRAISLASWKYHRRYVHLAQTCAALVHDISRSNVDAILVSGDLTNFGTPDEFAAAAEWLDALPRPALVIPGNHDCLVPQSRKVGLALWEKWSARSYPYVRIHNGVAVVGINSGIPTPPFMACGYVSLRQRKRLKTLLTNLGKRGFCRVVMIHHPPRRGLVRWGKSLLGMNKVAEILRSAGAEIVLHGHSHDATLTSVPLSDIPLLGVASASLDDDRPLRRACWNHLAISPHENGWHIGLERHRDDGVITERVYWVRPKTGPS